MLLAWLVEHATEPGTDAVRRVHGVVPLTGHTALTVAWQLAEQLQVSARTPGELLSVVARDRRRTVIVLADLHESVEPEAIEELVCSLAALAHVRVIVEMRQPSAAILAMTPAVMDLMAPQWTDPERYASWAAAQPSAGQDSTAPASRQTSVDLDDPACVCGADPVAVTAAYEKSMDPHGGLRAAWLRSGASVTRPQKPATRALVLWSALGDDADPRMGSALGTLAGEADWGVRWARVRGDISPPWPGPVRSLSAGVGELAGSVAVLDHQGLVRILCGDDGRPLGRLPRAAPGATAVTTADDGTMVLLDQRGRLSLQRSPTAPRPGGIASLLEDEPGVREHLVEEAVQRGRVTALACASELLISGDPEGAVQVLKWNSGGAKRTSMALHEGAVTDVAVVELAEGGALVYSGSQDGRVRLWATDREPLATAVAERDCAVTALSASLTGAGVALAIGWVDGLVEYSVTGAETSVRHFRPGPAVRALSVLPSGVVLIGTDESLICVEPS